MQLTTFWNKKIYSHTDWGTNTANGRWHYCAVYLYMSSLPDFYPTSNGFVETSNKPYKERHHLTCFFTYAKYFYRIEPLNAWTNQHWIHSRRYNMESEIVIGTSLGNGFLPDAIKRLLGSALIYRRFFSDIHSTVMFIQIQNISNCIWNSHIWNHSWLAEATMRCAQVVYDGILMRRRANRLMKTCTLHLKRI